MHPRRCRSSPHPASPHLHTHAALIPSTFRSLSTILAALSLSEGPIANSFCRMEILNDEKAHEGFVVKHLGSCRSRSIRPLPNPDPV
jgi:hypothetical protein